MEEHKAKKQVWTMMDKWKSTKVAKVHSNLDCNKISMHLSCLVDMVEALEVFFD